MTRRRREVGSAHRRLSAPAALGAALTLALAVSGCAPVLDASWTPPQWPDTALEVVDGPLAPLAADALGAAVQSDRVRSAALGVQARYASVPGPAGAALYDAVSGVVRAAIDARTAATGIRYAPEVGALGAGLGTRTCVPGSTGVPVEELLADPALAGPSASGSATVVCDIVWAQGGFFGQRLRTVLVGGDGAVADTRQLLYLDTATGEVRAAGDIWQPDAAAALAGEIVETSRRAAGSLSLLPVDDPDVLDAIIRALGSTTPSPEGGMQFTLAAGFTSPRLSELGVEPTAEPLTIRVPPARAESLLTDFGRALSASTGQEYTGPRVQSPADIRVDCSLTPCVSLTYDDGPSSLTPRLLDVLRDAGAPATFFVLGQYASGSPDTVRRAAAEGHEIGNHTWNHPSLPDLTAEQVRGQLDRTQALLRELSGQPVAFFRPPYGAYTNAVLAAAGQPAILWSVDTRDWAGPADDVLLDRAIAGPSPGGIVLFHDTHERSVRLAPDIIAGLRDRGFSFATLSELFGERLPASGAWRSAASPPAG